MRSSSSFNKPGAVVSIVEPKEFEQTSSSKIPGGMSRRLLGWTHFPEPHAVAASHNLPCCLASGEAQPIRLPPWILKPFLGIHCFHRTGLPPAFLMTSKLPQWGHCSSTGLYQLV